MVKPKELHRTSAREAILAAVEKNQPSPKELPSLTRDWIIYPDRLAQFSQVLDSIGAKFYRTATVSAANDILKTISVYSDAKQVISLVPGVGHSTVDLSTITDPHALEAVDFAVLPGEFGVAENGAIWVTDRNLPLRALYFIVQHLALVLSANDIVDNMHQAYERLRFNKAGFGTFIAGPSKTADIEQSLVIGAHGPRSLSVFCI